MNLFDVVEDTYYSIQKFLRPLFLGAALAYCGSADVAEKLDTSSRERDGAMDEIPSLLHDGGVRDSSDMSYSDGETRKPTDSFRATKIAAGGNHNCVVLEDGTARCWGLNDYGQLGDGTAVDRHTPIQVSELADIEYIALGVLHSCAVLRDGTTYCWGANWFGQLGDGTEIDRYTPTPVSGIENVTSIALGLNHTCALVESGPPYCWGSNERGQLGNGEEGPFGNRVNSLFPTAVYEGNGGEQIALGDNHTCELRNSVRCWGDNSNNQSIPSKVYESVIPRPRSVRNLEDVIQIALGGAASCALLEDRTTVECWGEAIYSFEPIIPELTNVIKIVVGGQEIDYLNHACALLENGTVRCFGANYAGQLGDGTETSRYNPTPPISGLENVTDVALGSEHSCALLGTGAVYCWGSNEYGQLGNGTTEDSLIPINVEGL